MQTKQRFNFSLPFIPGKKTWLLSFCWLLACTLSAQDLTRAKLDIWTETASFVYRDANMAEPAGMVNAKSLEDFVAAIKKEDAKSAIYSKVYQPIEQTGTYRKGKDAKAQLDLLIKSINSKLRENEQRMADLGRRRRLEDLYKQLQQIASDYTTPTALAQAGEESFTAPDKTATQVDTAVESVYAENQLSSIAKKQGPSKSPDWMSILALVLGLLNLGLIYFLYTGITKLNLRLDQRKKELETLSQQVNGSGMKTADGSGKITMAAIESLVQRTIAREMGHKPQANSPADRAVPTPAASPAVPFSVAQQAPPVERAAEIPQPQAPVPGPAPVTEPGSPAPAASPEKPVSFFARVPVNGSFHEQDLYPTAQHDSIYEIRVSRNDPNKAAFRIVTNTAVHRSAIESAYLSLKDACNYQMNNPQATHIVTDEPGTLTYQNGFWLIDRKAQVHFE
jgi:hypothetical protein